MSFTSTVQETTISGPLFLPPKIIYPFDNLPAKESPEPITSPSKDQYAATSSPEPETQSADEEYTPPPPSFEQKLEEAIDHPTGFPFHLRHAFLQWLNPFLEDTYLAAASSLNIPIVKNLALDEWYEEIKQNRIDLFDAHRQKTSRGRSAVMYGAAIVRHQFVHRKDISITQLTDAMELPMMFGYTGRRQRVLGAFSLLCAAAQPNAGEIVSMMFYKAVAMPELELTRWKTPFCKAMQTAIEKAVFQYTKKHSPEFLESRGWTVPEQAELPEWDRVYQALQDGKTHWAPKLVQTLYTDEDHTLLSECIHLARDLRNNTEHRHEELTTSQVILHVQNTIICLNVLGDHEAAVEAEILAEQWMTKASRAEVLLRLERAYVEQDLDEIEDPLRRRRELKRWEILTSILKTAPPINLVASPSTTSSESGEDEDLNESSPDEDEDTTVPLAKTSSNQEPQVPESIIVTFPDCWDWCRQSFYNSMHPNLMVLQEPVGSEPTYDQDEKTPTKEMDEWEREWLERVSTNSTPEIEKVDWSYQYTMAECHSDEAQEIDDSSDAESNNGYSSGGDTLLDDDDEPWISGETTPNVDESSDKELMWSDKPSSFDLSEAEGTWCNDESSLNQQW